MKKILLLCGCQSYFGVDLLKRVFEEQKATIDGEPPIKLIKINL